MFRVLKSTGCDPGSRFSINIVQQGIQSDLKRIDAEFEGPTTSVNKFQLNMSKILSLSILLILRVLMFPFEFMNFVYVHLLNLGLIDANGLRCN